MIKMHNDQRAVTEHELCLYAPLSHSATRAVVIAGYAFGKKLEQGILKLPFDDQVRRSQLVFFKTHFSERMRVLLKFLKSKETLSYDRVFQCLPDDGLPLKHSPKQMRYAWCYNERAKAVQSVFQLIGYAQSVLFPSLAIYLKSRGMSLSGNHNEALTQLLGKFTYSWLAEKAHLDGSDRVQPTKNWYLTHKRGTSFDRLEVGTKTAEHLFVLMTRKSDLFHPGTLMSIRDTAESTGRWVFPIEYITTALDYVAQGVSSQVYTWILKDLRHKNPAIRMSADAEHALHTQPFKDKVRKIDNFFRSGRGQGWPFRIKGDTNGTVFVISEAKTRAHYNIVRVPNASLDTYPANGYYRMLNSVLQEDADTAARALFKRHAEMISSNVFSQTQFDTVHVSELERINKCYPAGFPI